MDPNQPPKLTSAEIAALWSQYLNETAGICFNNHILQHVEDREIREVYEYALSLGNSHLESIKGFLEAEGFPVPVGFSEHDVTLSAPPLFSDVLSLNYINIMAIHGCHGYSGAITTSTRKDVRDYYTECNETAVRLCNRTKDIMLEKGLYYRAPVILPPERPDFVEDRSFLTGWIGNKRPLSCIEITDIYFNMKKSILAKAVITAFSQVVQSKKVRSFLLKAREVKEEHIQMFNDLLNGESLPAPPTLDSEVSNSQVSPYSDKLMMFQTGFLFSTAMIYYGTGWASSPRRDLSPKYMSAISGDLKVGNDWIDLMISNSWLEQPPLAEDRSKLAK